MKKQTKNTLKVLSTLALVGTLGTSTLSSVADAKEYKPEFKTENGKNYMKISDPSAKGQYASFGWYSKKNEKLYVSTIEREYNNQFVEVPFTQHFNDDSTLSVEKGDTLVSFASDDPDNEEDLKITGKLGIKYGEDTNSSAGKVETPQPTKQVETPVKPKEEKKETPTTTPKTTTQTETPKTAQTPTTPEKKVTNKKETPTPKTTQTQEQTKDNKQVTEKKETTAKPLPKTTAETFGGLTLYTFGGLSLLSILVFFGLRKKQK